MQGRPRWALVLGAIWLPAVRVTQRLAGAVGSKHKLPKGPIVPWRVD